MKKQVIVIIPSMNNRAYLEPCLNSLLNFTDGALLRVDVVNNGKPDSCDWINYDNVTIAQPRENLGWERALQRGLDRSYEPLVLFLNDDTLFLPRKSDWLLRLVADLDDPTVAAAGPSSNFVAGAQSTSYAPRFPALRYRARYLIGFCLLVRRSTLDEVGGIDTTLPGGDDIDLSIRFRQAGYTLVCDRSTYVYHYGCRTGHRVHGGPDRVGGWNSPQMIAATREALIAKHGETAFTYTWQQDPLGTYDPPMEVGE